MLHSFLTTFKQSPNYFKSSSCHFILQSYFKINRYSSKMVINSSNDIKKSIKNSHTTLFAKRRMSVAL